MKSLVIAFFLFVSLSAFLVADDITLSPQGLKSWQSVDYPIPDPTLPMQVKMDYVCTGPIRHTIRLVWLDEENREIGTFLSRPPFHYPVKPLWNKRLPLNQTVMPVHYPQNARAVRIKISSGYFANLPVGAKTTFIDPRIEWVYRVVSESPLNWFGLDEPVRFKAILPPAVTGIRGVVSDSGKNKIADVKSEGGIWSFSPERCGFYSVQFFWCYRDGRETPVSESFYVYGHKRQHNMPVRFREMKAFEHTSQSFVVTASRLNPQKSAESPFSFNLCAKNDDYRSYTLSFDDKFMGVRLMGADSAIRLHPMMWSEIESQPGIYDWEKVDHVLAIAERYGFSHDRIILNTFGTPRWNSPMPDDLVDFSYRYSSFAPKDLVPWAAYLKAFSKRYPKITQWELWNEPHLPGKSVFWQKSSPQQFVDLLKTGYQALKSVKQENTIILGGIGMRYMPFYDPFIKLGGAKWFDKVGTHCGYGNKPFRDIEAKYGAPHKPFVETEWHANLYNCNSLELPDEESLCFRMLVNLTNLLYLGKEKIATFNVFTSSSVPESARFKMKFGGIQQVSGLFRSVPIKEPRKTALALRTMTDQFAGRVTPMGAWYFGDGSQQGVLLSSDGGQVLLFWSQGVKNPLKLNADLAAAIEGKVILNWEGNEVFPKALKARQVYFVHAPLVAPLKRGSRLDEISPRPLKPELAQDYQGVYGPLSKPVYHEVKQYVSLDKKTKASDFSARYAIDVSVDRVALQVDVTDRHHSPECKDLAVWNHDSLQFAIDVVGDGFREDTLEFAVGKDNLIYKTKTPVLNGDLPVDYSEAKQPLTKSQAIITRKGNVTSYRVTVAPSDLYPFIYREGQSVRFSLLVNNNDGAGRTGYLEWASGIGGLKDPAQFGTLTVAAYGEIVAGQNNLNSAFEGGNVTPGNPVSVTMKEGDKVGGVAARGVAVTPGARYRFNAQVKGHGRLEIIGFGKTLKRIDFTKTELTDTWKTVFGEVTIPPSDKTVSLAFFCYKQPDATFLVRDFSLVAFK